MVETVKTIKGDREFLHLINFSGETQTVALRGNYQTIAQREKCGSTVELNPFGAVILRRE